MLFFISLLMYDRVRSCTSKQHGLGRAMHVVSLEARMPYKLLSSGECLTFLQIRKGILEKGFSQQETELYLWCCNLMCAQKYSVYISQTITKCCEITDKVGHPQSSHLTPLTSTELKSNVHSVLFKQTFIQI